MGLTTWKNAPQGPIRKADVTVAKNYLASEELSQLNRIVSMYLDFAEDQARRKKAMHMADWIDRLDAFLAFNERNILSHAGKISHQLAAEHAEGEFERYEVERRELEVKGEEGEVEAVVDQVRQLGRSPREGPSGPGGER